MDLNKVKLIAVLLLVLGVAGTAAALRGSPLAPPEAAEQPRPSAQARPDAPEPAPDAPAPRLDVKVVATFQHGGHVAAVMFSPDGDHLITAGNDANPQPVRGQVYNGRVKMWDLARGKEEAAVPPPFRYGVESAALSPDGRYLAVATSGYLLGPPGRPAAGEPGELVVFDTTGKKPAASLKGQSFHGNGLAFSPDGKTLAVAGSLQDRRGLETTPGGVVALWDLSKRKETALKGHKGHVRSVAFSPEGKLLASASGVPPANPRGPWKGELKLWDLAAGKEKAALEGFEGEVWCLAFSPDGALLATGGDKGVIRLWDVAKEKEVAALQGHKGGVVALAFSPDGKFLASGGDDPSSNPPAGELKLWDVAARKERDALSGHREAVHALAFDRVGKKLASAGSEGGVKVWAVTAAGKP
jgi:WD40 repeat protein